MAVGSITTCEELGEALKKIFEDKYDHLSFIERFTNIKHVPQDFMTNFNLRFRMTLDKIPVEVKPTPEHGFLYYLRVLNSDDSIMIQSMGGTTLPVAFEIKIRVENNLI